MLKPIGGMIWSYLSSELQQNCLLRLARVHGLCVVFKGRGWEMNLAIALMSCGGYSAWTVMILFSDSKTNSEKQNNGSKSARNRNASMRSLPVGWKAFKSRLLGPPQPEAAHLLTFQDLLYLCQLLPLLRRTG
jgi:hypothetical protein